MKKETFYQTPWEKIAESDRKEVVFMTGKPGKTHTCTAALVCDYQANQMQHSAASQVMSPLEWEVSAIKVRSKQGNVTLYDDWQVPGPEMCSGHSIIDSILWLTSFNH